MLFHNLEGVLLRLGKKFDTPKITWTSVKISRTGTEQMCYPSNIFEEGTEIEVKEI